MGPIEYGLRYDDTTIRLVGMQQPHFMICPFALRATSDEVSLSSSSSDRTNDDDSNVASTPEGTDQGSGRRVSRYNLGVGKNRPLGSTGENEVDMVVSHPCDGVVSEEATSGSVSQSSDNKLYWSFLEAVRKPELKSLQTNSTSPSSSSSSSSSPPTTTNRKPRRVRRMVARTQESSSLRGAIWHEQHYWPQDADEGRSSTAAAAANGDPPVPSSPSQNGPFPRPEFFYPDIDLSIPASIYDPQTSKDVIWDLMRWEAYQEAQREPLLVSFLYSSILNHITLESSLAFLLANKLSSAAMISTQVQSLILEALDQDPTIGRAVRADIMAVRDRDPACTCLPDVFLYFKGFHALQTYRVAHAIWKSNRRVLAHYLQSQMSQTFQIDIHPNATLGSGIMLDHGTGIVIGETSHLGHNCSILHHVTLGGSGKKGVDRHPKVGDGVLLGAGASILGNVRIGDGCQVGAGGLVITDLPPHSVAVGVPVRIIGSFIDVTEQPSVEMNQMMNKKIVGSDIFLSDGI